ncbi:MAG: hypothetical protein IPJ98_17985 [Bryobacterales bacterium]|nr:hypothetical protein [Bryobacterales bacterium]
MKRHDLDKFPFELDSELNRMKAPLTEELRRDLDRMAVPYEVNPRWPRRPSTRPVWTGGSASSSRAVKRWFYHDWTRIEPKLRTSIVEGISVFLSLFDDNPTVKRVFCPPKETYDPVVNRDGRYGIPLPPFAELIRRGTVCALNFPVATNPGLAKAVGTLMKQDFQRAVVTHSPDGTPAQPALARGALPLRRIPVLRHSGRE